MKHVVQSRLPGSWQCLTLAALVCWIAFLSGAATEKLAWKQETGYRHAPAIIAPNGKTGFTLLPATATGIQFSNHLAISRAMANQNLMNGAGVALGDYDGDGLCDLYFCNLGGTNALYRNLGDWKFEEVAATAGVACTNRSSTGAVFADLNGDGRLDLVVVSCGGPNSCFFNEGNGHFREAVLPAGESTRTGSNSITLADVDGDGDLDLFVANYGEISILRSGGMPSVKVVNGKEEVVGRLRDRIKIRPDGTFVELGEPAVLYLNNGKGDFAPVPWTGGAFLDEDGKPLTAAFWDLGLSAAFHDLNGDGFPDLYICNDFQTPDRIWINDGKGHFRALPRLAMRHSSSFSMSVDFADINRDGLVDFFVADMLSPTHYLKLTQIDGGEHPPRIPGSLDDRPQIRRNTLFVNRGDGTYGDIANFAGVAASDWTWCSVFLDVDLDGYEDLLIANGHAFDTQDSDAIENTRPTGKQSINESRRRLLQFPPLAIPNLIYRNRRDLTFEETGAKWGFDSKQVSHGIALADLDNDGDQDVVVSCLNAPPLIYRNDSPAARVAVRLKGSAANTAGIGAKITVLAPPLPPQSLEIIAGGRYLSSDEPMRAFATGSTTNVTIQVKWRSGKESVVNLAAPNHLYEIDEASAQPASPTAAPPAVTPFFEDVSARLGHVHHEEYFNDFARQPLLPKVLSQLGPGVAWLDLDGDGHEDLVIGSGRGGQLAAYQNDGKGGFKRLESPALKSSLADDVTGMAIWTGKPGERVLLAGQANYESSETNSSSLLKLDWQSGTVHRSPFTAHPLLSTTGPLAVADLDGDGDLDLFVGGRAVPGRYPENAGSHVFRNENGELKLDAVNTEAVKDAGLVSGAVWGDVDGDGYPELILACEWGPVRIYRNEKGHLREATTEFGLGDQTGWWQSVAIGDFDGDGRLDFVAGNWGLNSAYHPTAANPARLYHGDFDQNGTYDLLEAETDPATQKVVPVRSKTILGQAIPLIQSTFATHKLFANAAVNDVLAPAANKGHEARATTLATTVFLNRGSKFEARALPAEAQWSPAQGISVADFDGDGHEDIFLAQNVFALRPEDPRLDAGRGLWLRGDGQGGFQPVIGQASGLLIEGEQRGCATSDFDGDGRVDLVVTQNGAATKLYRNRQAKPGLRVRLAGAPGNPNGIGAVIRLIASDKSGPAREIHAGSGYWSQASVVEVLAATSETTGISVRWPGGKTTTTKLTPGAKEIVINVDGTAPERR